MEEKSIKHNYLFNVSYQVLLLIVPLIIAPYLSRVLGPDGVGTASYVESIMLYFALFATMGITTYGQREISFVRDDLTKRSLVFWNTKVLSFCISLIVILIYVVFSLLQKKNSVLYLILTLYLLSVFFDITWFFQGMEEFGKIIGRNAIVKILQVIYIFFAVKTRADLPYYVLSLGLFTLLGNISLWGYLPKYITKIPLCNLRPFREFKVVWSFFIPAIAIQIYTVLDKTMIGVITGNSYENGYYEQAIKMSKLLLAVVTALGTVMIPRIAHLYIKGKTIEVQRLMYRGYRFVWFLGVPICFGMIMTAGNFVPWFLGAGYEKVINLLWILPLLILAIGISNVTGTQYLIPTKRQNLFTLTVIIGAFTNFSLNMILIHFFQSIGAAIASVVAETTIAIVQLIFVRKELSPLRVLKEGINYYIAGFVMVLALLPICHILAPSILNTLIITLCGTVVYFSVLLIERDQFFLSNLKIIIKKIRQSK